MKGGGTRQGDEVKGTHTFLKEEGKRERENRCGTVHYHVIIIFFYSK